MVQSFKSFLTLRIGALICILVVASFAFYLSRADTIEKDLRAERAQTLGNILAQRLEKKRDVGITNAISMAAGGNMADLVAYGQRDRAEAELKRIGDVFKARSNFQGIKIQLFNNDFSVLLRNWKPQSYGDTPVPVLPLLKKVASSGKAEADFVVDKDGFFLRGTAPLTRNGKDIGFLQFLQGVGSVSRDFEKEGTSYALLLTPEVAANSPSISKAPRYGQLFLAKKAWFSEKVRKTLGSLNMESLIKSGDMLDNDNFAVAIPLDDFTGKRIGYHILVEPEARLAAKIDAATSTARIFIVIMALGFLLMGVLILFMLNRTLLRPMHSLAGYAQAVTEGDMEKEFTTPTRYELKTLAKTILTMIRGLQERTEHAQKKAEQARIKGREAREALEKANREEQHISRLFASLKEASTKAEDISHKALSAVNELSGEVDLVTRGVEVQRDRMMETATAMEEMNSTVAEVARNASDAALNAASSREKATTGAEGVHSAVESIGHIETRIHKLKDTMTQLGEQASSIGTVLGVITEIADQTNLLALNAAIEAARAGEAGRGFAVVADEVRKLAEKTMDATKEVESVIISIQDSAKDNVRAVEAAAEDITRSTEASNEAGRFMQEIVAIVEETSLQVDSIATASEEQSATSEEINRAVSDVNSIAAESAQGMQRSAENLASITALVGELDATIQKIAAGETGDATSQDLMTWSDKLSVGINSIDAQHKKLVQMINDLNRAMKDKRSRDTLMRIVEDLGEYVVTHFSYEEKLFDKHGYPDTDSHKAIHEEFVNKVKEFGEALAAGRTTVSLDVLKFLKDWLVEHIMGTDKEYGPFLQKHGVR